MGEGGSTEFVGERLTQSDSVARSKMVSKRHEGGRMGADGADRFVEAKKKEISHIAEIFCAYPRPAELSQKVQRG